MHVYCSRALSVVLEGSPHYRGGTVVQFAQVRLVLYNVKYSETSDKGHSERGQAKSTLVYTLYRKSPLKEDNLSTKDKIAGPEGVLIKRFHCIGLMSFWLLKYS